MSWIDDEIEFRRLPLAPRRPKPEPAPVVEYVAPDIRGMGSLCFLCGVAGAPHRIAWGTFVCADCAESRYGA